MHIHLDISGKLTQRGHTVLGFVSEDKLYKHAVALPSNAKKEAGVYDLNKKQEENLYLILVSELLKNKKVSKITPCKDYPRSNLDFLLRYELELEIEDFELFKKRTGHNHSLSHSFIRNVRKRLKKFKNIHRNKFFDNIKINILTTKDILDLIEKIK